MSTWTTRKTKRSIWTGKDYLQDVARDFTFMWNLNNNQKKQKKRNRLINRGKTGCCQRGGSGEIHEIGEGAERYNIQGVK